jgi:para-nitrobenzyl esterase
MKKVGARIPGWVYPPTVVFAIAAVFAILPLFAIPALKGLRQPIQIEGGAITGTPAWGWGVQLYRGIPYAAPPVGDLRWRPPQPVASWQGVRAADHFSARCMQRASRGAPKGALWSEPRTHAMSEDCLYLNIWTPASSAADKLPVIVFFHGGGGTSGEGSEAIWDGSMMAKKGVIFVTANYRLGIFGNFALPALIAESEHHSAGNYGELDKLAAVRWLKNNIVQFGGDPNNITIMGHSSESRSMNDLQASPLAKGLFERIIAQSHTGFDRTETLAEAEHQGEDFAQSIGKPTLEAVRGMSAKDLEAAVEAKPSRHSEGSGLIDGDAVVDGWFLPADPNTIFNENKQLDVSLLTGGTNDEHGRPEDDYQWFWYHTLAGDGPGPAPRTPSEYVAWAQKAFGKQADSLLKLYPGRTDAEVAKSAHDIGRDAILQGHRVWVQFQSKDGTHAAYLYLFSHKPPLPSTPGTLYPVIGAIHGGEFFYVLDNLHVKDLPWTATDRKVADIASSYWTNFAKTGNPNGPGLPNWSAYNVKTDELMNIADNPHMEPVPDKAGIDFLALWDQHFRTVGAAGEGGN